MKRRHHAILLGLTVGVFLALAIPHATHPSLFTIEQGSMTPHHTNPEALTRISQEKTGDVASIMQEVLDSSCPIVIDIRIKNFEDAQDELKEYAEKIQHFNNLVINLDMSDSEIKDFRQKNSQNLETMEELLSNSIGIEELKTLEIRYRDEENPQMQYSVMLEREALENLIMEHCRDYDSNSEQIFATAGKFNLNTEEYRTSVEEVRGIADEIVRVQETREMNRTPLSGSTITISITPDTATYGDTVTISGLLTGDNPSEQQVLIFIDSTPWKTVATSHKGWYSAGHSIGRIREGTHLVYSAHDSTYSEVVPFRICTTNTTLTLSVTSWNNASQVLCTGMLAAGNLPVGGANITIYVDQLEAGSCTTRPDGRYNQTITLEEGEHTLQAYFSGDGFPLNASASEVRQFTVQGVWSPVSTAVIYLLVLGMSVAGAGAYLKRRGRLHHGRTIDANTGPLQGVEEGSSGQTSMEEQESPQMHDALEEISDRYLGLWDQEQWSEAAHLLYADLRWHLRKRYRIVRIESMTPRELAAMLSIEPVGADLSLFVCQYEEVFYRERRPSAVQKETILSLWRAIINMIRRGHEAA